MPISPTNQTKNEISPSNETKSGFFLLKEDGGYLLLENGGRIVLDLVNYGADFINQVKNAIAATNQAKS